MRPELANESHEALFKQVLAVDTAGGVEADDVLYAQTGLISQVFISELLLVYLTLSWATGRNRDLVPV